MPQGSRAQAHSFLQQHPYRIPNTSAVWQYPSQCTVSQAPAFISQHPYRMLIRAEFGDTRGSAAVRMSSSPSHIGSAARAMSGDSLDGEQRKGMSCRPNRHSATLAAIALRPLRRFREATPYEIRLLYCLASAQLPSKFAIIASLCKTSMAVFNAQCQGRVELKKTASRAPAANRARQLKRQPLQPSCRYHSRALQHRFGRFRCYRLKQAELSHCHVCQSISRRQQEPPGRTAYDEHTAATTESDRACRAFIVSPLTVSTIQAGVVKCTHRSDVSPPAAFIVPVSVPQDPGRSKEEVAMCWSTRRNQRQSMVTRESDASHRRCLEWSRKHTSTSFPCHALELRPVTSHSTSTANHRDQPHRIARDASGTASTPSSGVQLPMLPQKQPDVGASTLHYAPHPLPHPAPQPT
ncbi:hypothetical protein L1887_43997 [Cichorium endivia]|nr:hypothetical protein L1887_43997 [Cichorium endivia]